MTNQRRRVYLTQSPAPGDIGSLCRLQKRIGEPLAMLHIWEDLPPRWVPAWGQDCLQVLAGSVRWFWIPASWLCDSAGSPLQLQPRPDKSPESSKSRGGFRDRDIFFRSRRQGSVERLKPAGQQQERKSAAALAAQIGCSRSQVESARKRGQEHLAGWTTARLGAPWEAVSVPSAGKKRFYFYRPCRQPASRRVP